MKRLKKRDEALDAVKGFAILVVMLGHCIGLNGFADPYVYDAIVAVQMPLFMLVSGFVSGRKPLEPSQKPDLADRMQIFGKRSLSYLLPFFVWLFITHPTNPFEELKLQLFALDRGLWFLMTLWIVTLVTMTASYLADFAAYKAKGNAFLRFVIFCGLTGMAYLGFIMQARSGNSLLSPSLTVKYLPFYIAGYLWALYVVPFIARTNNKNQRLLANGVFVLCTVIYLYLVAAFDMIVVTDAKSLLAQMAASLAGSFVCFYGIYHFAKGKLKRGLSLIGQYTLEIYVLHFRFARILGIGAEKVAIYSLQAALWVLAVFLIMSLLTALCIFVIKKVWILDFLLFGKKRKNI